MRLARRADGSAWLVAVVLTAAACDNGSGPGITLDVTPDSAHLFRNDTVRLSVFAVNGDGELVSGVPVRFESADTSIVTVTSLGLVRAGEQVGRTTVRVSGGGAHRDIPVAVHARPALIIVGPTDTLIAVGQTVQMHASVFDEHNLPITDVTPIWESSNPTRVSVSTTGLARGDSALGVAMITARVGNIVGFAWVYVRGPVAIVINPRDTTVNQGDTVRFRATVYDQVDSIPGVTITWQTTNPTLVTMTSNGTARTANNASGQAHIIARYGTLSDLVTLTVRDTTILGNRVSVPGSPYAAAISVDGVAYVVTLGGLARADLPSQTFRPAADVGSVPTEVAFNSTGTRAYVTNQFSRNVSVVDVAADSQIDVIPVSGDPFDVIVPPGDSVLYVSTNTNNVYAIRLATNAIITQFSTGSSVANSMIIRDDTLLYASTVYNGTVIEWNLKTRSIARTFPVGGTPQKMALSADGNTLYIANLAGYVQFWNLVSGLQDGTNIALPQGTPGYGIARRPTTGKLYVTTAYFSGGSIYLLDPATRTITNAVVTNGSTREVVFDSTGLGFVPNESGWVDFIK